MRPHRSEKVASEVRTIVSDAIANRLSDPRISRLTSVTRVRVSADLAVADVFVSVFGTPGEQNATIAALAHARGHVREMIARGIRLRQCPDLRFHLDDSIQRGTETLRLIAEQTGSNSLTGIDEPPPDPEADA